MLKLIPYTKQLISIGNQHHYEGQLVWSDGKVAYGWDYSPQAPAPHIKKVPFYPGFWVSYYNSTQYKLVDLNLNLTQEMDGRLGYTFDCYPVFAVDSYLVPEHGTVYTPNGSYTYTGAVIAMDNTGKLLVYDDFKLYQYDETGNRTTTNLSSLKDSGNLYVRDAFGTSTVYQGVGQYESSRDMRVAFQLATTAGAYVSTYDRISGDPIVYYVGGGNITPAGIPQTWQVGQGVELRLSDMALIVDGQTFPNDPLGLLNPQNQNFGFVYPGGVHSWYDNNYGYYVMSQDSGRLWHNGQTITVSSFENCFNLTYMRKKWKRYFDNV